MLDIGRILSNPDIGLTLSNLLVDLGAKNGERLEAVDGLVDDIVVDGREIKPSSWMVTDFLPAVIGLLLSLLMADFGVSGVIGGRNIRGGLIACASLKPTLGLAVSGRGVVEPVNIDLGEAADLALLNLVLPGICATSFIGRGDIF